VLKLPTYENLSLEQDNVLDLPLDRNHIVIGPPGSGKTVLAIYRAQMLSQKKGEPTLLIMYNKLLRQYTSAALKTLGIDGIATTFHNWFPVFFKRTYGQPPREVAPYVFDWDACIRTMLDRPPPKKERVHVLIDEGQDMPKGFFLVMTHVAQSLTVFADENQRITRNQSTVAEICAATGIGDIHRLTLNYRNTLPIASFASSFHVGIETGIAEVPDENRPGLKPVLEHNATIAQTVTRLVNLESSRSNEPIGVFVYTTTLQKKLYNRLKGKTKRAPEIYSADQAVMANRTAIDWNRPGIKIVAFASAKGLEFGTLILSELQSVTMEPDTTEFRMLFYVLASRARRELFLMYSGEGEPRALSGFDMTLLDDRRST
jgi:DNA helicase IV